MEVVWRKQNGKVEMIVIVIEGGIVKRIAHKTFKRMRNYEEGKMGENVYDAKLLSAFYFCFCF